MAYQHGSNMHICRLQATHFRTGLPGQCPFTTSETTTGREYPITGPQLGVRSAMQVQGDEALEQEFLAHL